MPHPYHISDRHFEQEVLFDTLELVWDLSQSNPLLLELLAPLVLGSERSLDWLISSNRMEAYIKQMVADITKDTQSKLWFLVALSGVPCMRQALKGSLM
jgi:hypothetical protein